MPTSNFVLNKNRVADKPEMSRCDQILTQKSITKLNPRRQVSRRAIVQHDGQILTPSLANLHTRIIFLKEI
jgi:hypothetical protein